MKSGGKRILFSLVQVQSSRKHEAGLQNFHSDDVESSVAEVVGGLHSQEDSACSLC